MNGQRLAGRRALVTGAASGIGCAIARRFVDEGAAVLASDIAPDVVALGAFGIATTGHDVSSASDWARVVDEAVAQLGGLDILINNAGVVSGRSIEDVDLEIWNRILAINLTGTMLGCQAAIGVMKHAGRPCAIVNVASTTAYAALPADVAYTASKSAVRMLTKSVATHCAKAGYPIRCNTLIPGATDSAILQPLPADVRTLIAATAPQNRLADPAEMAAAAVFLASDECPFMTGAELLADGGALAIHPGF
jgi:3(or 17)beta-hydroxysteroid dehydrogenase